MDRTISSKIVVGTRIHSILYGGRDGIVVAIHGEQNPDSVRSLGGGVMMMGGNAHFDIVFDNGAETRRLPECILRGVQWRIYAEVADANEIHEASQFCIAETARRKFEEDEARVKFAAAVEALRTDPQYSKLTQVGDGHGGGKLVAANLRIELKAAFPGVKFGVRSDYNSVRLSWIDGPTTDAVKALTGKYEGGHFDGMDDSYHHVKSPFTSVFGSAQYIFENRSYSPTAMRAAAEAVQKRYDWEPFTIEESSDGTAYVDCTSHDHQRVLYDFLEKRYPFNSEEVA